MNGSSLPQPNFSAHLVGQDGALPLAGRVVRRELQRACNGVARLVEIVPPAVGHGAAIPQFGAVHPRLRRLRAALERRLPQLGAQRGQGCVHLAAAAEVVELAFLLPFWESVHENHQSLQH